MTSLHALHNAVPARSLPPVPPGRRYETSHRGGVPRVRPATTARVMLSTPPLTAMATWPSSRSCRSNACNRVATVSVIMVLPPVQDTLLRLPPKPRPVGKTTGRGDIAYFGFGGGKSLGTLGKFNPDLALASIVLHHFPFQNQAPHELPAQSQRARL